MKLVIAILIALPMLSACMSSLGVAPLATLLQCRQTSRSSDSIIGGVTVAYGDPDQKLVTMLSIRRPDRDAVCTGTLISDRVILTAAHCVDNVEPSSIFANFTTSSGCPVNQLREMRAEVIKTIIHKDFDGTPQGLADVALLYLEENAPDDQERVPVLSKDLKLTSDRILLIGFGITAETKKDSQVLRRIYKSWRHDVTPHGRALLVNQSNASGGFCRGDSGAPIIGEVWGEPYVIAVNSANIGMKPQTECQTMSLAMDSTQFSEWITRNRKDIESSNWVTRLFTSDLVRVN